MAVKNEKAQTILWLTHMIFSLYHVAELLLIAIVNFHDYT